jgi:hypothetical protein
VREAAKQVCAGSECFKEAVTGALSQEKYFEFQTLYWWIGNK